MRRWLRTLLASVVVVSAVGATSRARAQTPDELAAGRQLFAEALQDEEHQQFAVALEKYKRVAKMRDTAAIRYRMGITLEALGKPTQAIDAYAAAVRLGGATGKDADLVRVSQARVDALEPKVAHLALRLRTPSTATEVKVDGEPVATEAMADIRLDPGAHVVTATAPSAEPFRAQVTLSEGGRAEIPIAFEALSPPPPVPAPEPKSNARTIGIVSVVAGGVFVVGGVVVLALRSSAISDLKTSCPDGACPAAREQELRDTRDRALFEGPLGVTFLAAGALAVGAGVVLFATASDGRGTSTRLAPSPIARGGLMMLTRDF